MSNHPNRSRLTITINEQHLYGNDPPEFDATRWLSALEREYRSVVRAHFPNARTIVHFDCQNASGYCRPVSIDWQHDSRVDAASARSLEFNIGRTPNALYDARGEEFFS